MNCKRAQAAISLFLDDRLDPAGQTRLNHHLDGCPECAAFLQDLREGLAVLQALPLESPSINFDWNLRRKLQQAQQEGWRFQAEQNEGRFWPRFVLSAAAALVLALGGGYLTYRSLQAPVTFPLTRTAPSGQELAGEALSIPETPQPFPGAVQDAQRGFQPVGGSELIPTARPEHWTIQAADPRRPLDLRPESSPGDSLGDSAARAPDAKP